MAARVPFSKPPEKKFSWGPSGKKIALHGGEIKSGDSSLAAKN